MKRFLFAFCVASTMLCGCIESTEPQAVVQKPSRPDEGQAADSTANQDSEGIVYGDKFPEVLDVEVVPATNQNMRFNVTLSSTYDSPQRYADAWRVLDSQGNQLGIRVLGHDHASEQPFTRSETIKLPAGTNPRLSHLTGYSWAMKKGAHFLKKRAPFELFHQMKSAA